jgi:hypothetical protein
MRNATQEEVLRLFEYREDGLYWKERRRSDFKTEGRWQNWNQRYSNQKAGSKSGPYVNVSINKIRYQEHRLVFLMFHGITPQIIDHIDGNRQNNNISNLRASTHTENLRNSKRPKHNQSGYKNVGWNKQKNKWQVKLTISKKSKSFGFYNDIDLADLVAYEARRLYFGCFANHGTQGV